MINFIPLPLLRYLFYVSMNAVTLITRIYMSTERLLAVTTPFVHARLDGRIFNLATLTCIWLSSQAIITSGMHRMKDTMCTCLYHVMVPLSTHLIIGVLGLIGIILIVTVDLRLYGSLVMRIAGLNFKPGNRHLDILFISRSPSLVLYSH